jgi:putative membrane protein
MAWIRTAASLISFGFTLYKFFQDELQKGQPVQGGVLGPRRFAMIMISIGVIALIASTIQHRQNLKDLRNTYGVEVVPYSTSTFVAVLFSLFGIIALVAVILHL